MKRLFLSLFLIPLLSFGAETKFAPVIFGPGSSLTIQSGVAANFASGSTVTFTGANIVGLSASGLVGTISQARLGTGSNGSGTHYLADDQTFKTIGGGDALVANPLSQFAATTSLQLRGVLTDESGTGVFLTTNGSAAGLTSFPTFNQDTTGSADHLTTPRTINGTPFNGSANIIAPLLGDTAPKLGGNLDPNGHTITGYPATTDLGTLAFLNSLAFSGVTGFATRSQIDWTRSAATEAATITLAPGSASYSTASGTLTTVAFSGSPSATNPPITLNLIVTSGPYTLTIPTSRRVGDTNSTTSLVIGTGNHELSWKYINGAYWLSDSTSSADVRTVTAVFDGAGSALATGNTTVPFTIPYAGTITGWSISVDSGTATCKVWKKAAGTAIPTIADVINTSGVAISTGTHIRSATVSDFTSTAVTAGDQFIVALTAVSSATKLVFEVEITR